MPDSIYKVYWIRDPNHTDPFTEGYVGITYKEAEERWNRHRLRAEWWHDGVVCDVVIVVDTVEEALRLEKYYRPEPNIGWNKSKGGHGHACPHSEETKKVISEKGMGNTNKKGVILTPEQRETIRVSQVNPYMVWIEGTSYDSVRYASRETGINRSTLMHRIASDNFPEYYYDNETTHKPTPTQDPSSRSVEIEGEYFISVSAAAKALGMQRNTLGARLHSDTFPEWRYAD